MQSSAIFQQSAGQKTYSYTDTTVIATSSVVSDAYYDQNDTLSGFMNSTTITSGLVSNGPGFLQLPAVNFDGTCNDNNYAKFEVDIQDNNVDATCLRSFSTNLHEFEAQCLYQQSTTRYVTDLWIAK